MLSAVSRYCHICRQHQSTEDSWQHLPLASAGGELRKLTLLLRLPGFAQRTETQRGSPHRASLPCRNPLKDGVFINVATVVYGEPKAWEEEKTERTATVFSTERKNSFLGRKRWLGGSAAISVS